MKTIDEQLKDLTQVYGAEIMLQACKNIVEKSGTQTVVINADSLCSFSDKLHDTVLQVSAIVREATKLPEIQSKYHVIYPDQILETSDNLLVSANDLMEMPTEHYSRKAEIMKRVKQLEVEITLKEAEAFMQAVDGQVMIDGKAVKLSNAEMRDAYRRQYSADLRKQRGELEAELAEIDTLIAENKEKRENIVMAAECNMKRAGLQSALLGFLGRGVR